MKTLLVLLAVLATGCTALDRYERTYSMAVDADSKSGSLSMTLRPIASPTGSTPPDPVMAMDDKTIAKIIEIVTKAAEKNAKDPEAAILLPVK